MSEAVNPPRHCRCRWALELSWSRAYQHHLLFNEQGERSYVLAFDEAVHEELLSKQPYELTYAQVRGKLSRLTVKQYCLTTTKAAALYRAGVHWDVYRCTRRSLKGYRAVEQPLHGCLCCLPAAQSRK